MTEQTYSSKQTAVVALLSLTGIALLVAMYFSPIWWVSLTAPNYPAEAFPDGVRIEFAMNGVFNGCKKVDKAEVDDQEALDCVHEMDTINHYVGMFPIATGGVIEKGFSPYLVAMLAVMLLGFMCTKPKIRMVILSAGFAAVVVWMDLSFMTPGGLKYQNAAYVKALVSALDESNEKEASLLARGEALRLLKQSLGREVDDDAPPGSAAPQPLTDKDNDIAHLKAIFEADQGRKPEARRQHWDGSAMQMLVWHYQVNLGRYFNNPAVNDPMAANIEVAATIVFWGLPLAMLLLIFGARKNGGLLYWLLVVVPIALPLVFVIDYAGWLWWFGHTLNSMGAFTVKPFMPTVLGDGKVAQFATHSYPSIGFGIMVACSLVLTIAALLRRKQFKG